MMSASPYGGGPGTPSTPLKKQAIVPSPSSSSTIQTQTASPYGGGPGTPSTPLAKQMVVPDASPTTVNPLGPQPGSPQYYARGNWVASHSGAEIAPRYNVVVVGAEIQKSNPNLLAILPEGAVPVSYNQATQEVAYLTGSQYAAYQASVKYYTEAGYPEFAGKYAPLPNVASSRIASLREDSATQSLEATLKPNTSNSRLESAKQASEIQSNFQLRSNTRQGTSPTGASNAVITQGLTAEEKAEFDVWRGEKVKTGVLNLGLFLVAGTVAPVAGTSGVVLGVVGGPLISQVIKSATVLSQRGKLEESLLSPQEIYESATTGVIFSGAGKLAIEGISRLGPTGAKVAGFTSRFNPETGLVEKVIVAPTSIKQAVGAIGSRVGVQTGVGVGIGESLEVAQTGEITAEGVAQNAVFAAGFAGVGELAGSVRTRLPTSLGGGVKAKTFELSEVELKTGSVTSKTVASNIEILPKEGIVDVPFEGSGSVDASSKALLKTAGLDSAAKLGLADVTRVTSVKIVNKRVSLAEAKSAREIWDANQGAVLDIAGTETVTSFKPPMQESLGKVGVGGKLVSEVDTFGNVVGDTSKDVDVKSVSTGAGEVTTYGVVDVRDLSSVRIAEASFLSKSNLVDMTKLSGQTKQMADNFLPTTEEGLVGDVTGVAQREMSIGGVKEGAAKKLSVVDIELGRGNLEDATTLGEALGRKTLDFSGGGTDKVAEVTSWVASDDVGALRKQVMRQDAGVQFSQTRNAEPYLAAAKGDDFAAVVERGAMPVGKKIMKITTGEANLDAATQAMRFESGMEVPDWKVGEFDIELPKVKGKSEPAVLMTGKETLAEPMLGSSLTVRENMRFKLSVKVPINQTDGLEVLLNRRELSLRDRLANKMGVGTKREAGAVFPESFRDQVFKELDIGEMEGAPKGISAQFIAKGKETKFTNDVGDIRSDTGHSIPIGDAGLEMSTVQANQRSYQKPFNTQAQAKTPIAEIPKDIIEYVEKTEGLKFKQNPTVEYRDELMKGARNDVDVLVDKTGKNVVDVKNAKILIGKRFLEPVQQSKYKYATVGTDKFLLIHELRENIEFQHYPNLSAKSAHKNALKYEKTDVAWLKEKGYVKNIAPDLSSKNTWSLNKNFDVEAYSKITKGNRKGEKAFEGYELRDSGGNIIRDINNNPIYEAYSKGSKTEQMMKRTGKPVDPTQRKYKLINVPKNIISADIEGSQAPINLQGLASSSSVAQQNQTDNPFVQYRGRTYYRQPVSGEEYEYASVSYPKSGLPQPSQINVGMQNNLGMGVGVSFIQGFGVSSVLGIGQSQKDFTLENTRSIVSQGSSELSRLDLGLTHDVGLYPLQDVRETPLPVEPLPERVTTQTLTTEILTGTKPPMLAFSLPDFKFEGRGTDSPPIAASGKANKRIRYYPVVDPLETFEAFF